MIITLLYFTIGIFLIFFAKEQRLKIDLWFSLFTLLFWPGAVSWGFYKAYKKIQNQKKLMSKLIGKK